MTMPASRYERERIHNISDRDFWSAWKENPPALRRIAAAGRADDPAAWPRLAAWLRERTADAWAAARSVAARRLAGNPRAGAQADDVLAGRINGWAAQTINFGQHIDFNTNFGQSGQYGFHYMGWLTPLTDRALALGRPADLDRLLDVVRQYYAQRNRIAWRIPGLDPVYYELGARAKTNQLLPVFLALLHTRPPGRRDLEPFLKLFLGFGRSLLRLQRGGYRVGNWQIVGNTTLFLLGTVFADWKEAGAWRRRATRSMLQHAARDFYADGGHHERCWGYGWMSLGGIIKFYETGVATGFLSRPHRARLRTCIRRGFRWFAATVTPAGALPAYGDGDLRLAPDIWPTAAKYLGAVRRPARSLILKPSGYAVMRDGTRYLNVNFGPSGGWHTHDDLLDFNAWAFGEPIIEEVARFDSYDHPLNAFFRAPEAHNQVVIDHQRMNRATAAGRSVRWHSSRMLDYFSAWHDGFQGHPARIHRHILFVKGAYWLVWDVIQPLKECIFAVSSYLHAVRPFRITGPGAARISGRVGAWIKFARPETLRRLETGTDIAAVEVTTPRLFPERHFLRARQWPATGAAGNLVFAVLIHPYRGRAPAVEIAARPLAGGAPGAAESFRVRSPAGTDTVVFNPFLKKGLRLDGVPVHARLLFRRGGHVTRVP